MGGGGVFGGVKKKIQVLSVKILPEAGQLIDNAFYYAETNFGGIAVQRWEKELSRIMDRIRFFPKSYERVHILKSIYKQEFRSAVIRRNFRIVFLINESLNEIIIVDLWDLRMSEENRLRQIERVIRRNRL